MVVIWSERLARPDDLTDPKLTGEQKSQVVQVTVGVQKGESPSISFILP